MAGIRLEFAQFGDFDSFDIVRSPTSMASVANADLPTPIVTGLKTMYYVDPNVIKGNRYYYKVRVWHGTTSFVSSELVAYALLTDLHYNQLIVALLMDSPTVTNKAAGSGTTFNYNGRAVKDTVNTVADCPTLAFANTSNFFDIVNNNLSFGTGDFCIQGWVRLDTYPGGGGDNDMSIVDLQNGFFLYCHNTTGELRMWDGTANVGLNGGTAGRLPLNTWCFVEASRTAGVFRLFLDGKSLGSANYTRNLNSVGFIRVAGSTYMSTTRQMRGNMARFSVYKGWGGNTANYTPPVEPEYLHWV